MYAGVYLDVSQCGHLWHDSIYGDACIALDVRERLRTRERNAMEDQILAYRFGLLDRAAEVSRRARDGDMKTARCHLHDINARTLRLWHLQATCGGYPPTGVVSLRPSFPERSDRRTPPLPPTATSAPSRSTAALPIGGGGASAVSYAKRRYRAQSGFSVASAFLRAGERVDRACLTAATRNNIERTRHIGRSLTSLYEARRRRQRDEAVRVAAAADEPATTAGTETDTGSTHGRAAQAGAGRHTGRASCALLRGRTLVRLTKASTT